MSARFSGVSVLMVGIAAGSVLWTATAQASCVVEVCNAPGNRICWQTDSDPSLHLVYKDNNGVPQFAFWWGNGTRYDVRLGRQWETGDGLEVP